MPTFGRAWQAHLFHHSQKPITKIFCDSAVRGKLELRSSLPCSCLSCNSRNSASRGNVVLSSLCSKPHNGTRRLRGGLWSSRRVQFDWAYTASFTSPYGPSKARINLTSSQSPRRSIWNPEIRKPIFIIKKKPVLSVINFGQPGC